MMLSEARAEKALTPAEVKQDAEHVAHIMWLGEVAEWLRGRPEVGTLTREGQMIFYVYPVGGEYREVPAFEVAQ